MGIILAIGLLSPVFAQEKSEAFQTRFLQAVQQKSMMNAPIGGVVLDWGEINRFYAARGFSPVWNVGINWALAKQEDPVQLQQFLTALTNFAREQGIVFSVDPLPLFARLAAQDGFEASIQLELLLTHYILDLAHALRGDRTSLSALYAGWEFEKTDVLAEVDLPVALARAAVGDQLVSFLSRLVPSHEAYRDLVLGLKKYASIEARGGWPVVPWGETLHKGDRSSRVVVVRERLKAEGYEVAESSQSDLFDEALERAVINFQIRNGLKPDGGLGVKTLAVMNVSAARRVETIQANMERWRHMPAVFPDRYLVVNIPAFVVDYMEAGRSSYRDAVIVGRPDRKTPFIQSEIRSVIFNPSWHVPAKIARKDILPKLRKDPHYLEKMGFVINGSADDPYGAAIDWHRVRESEFHFRLRQAPGDLNSLGRLKFDFDNDFAVYLHGTPNGQLFEKAERALSSGCVRVHDPDRLAAIVLHDNAGAWGDEKIKTTIDAQSTKWLRVERALPLYVVYWTVLAGQDDGPRHFRQDIYGYDRLIMEEIAKNQRAKRRGLVVAGAK